MRGLAKCVVVTTIAALVIAGVLWGLSLAAPTITGHWLLRIAMAFIVAWVLFSVAHWAAGMTSWLVTGLVVLLAFAVMVSTVFPIVQAMPPTGSGTNAQQITAGQLLVLLGFSEGLPLLAILLCAWVRHEGDNTTLLDILGSR